MLSLHLHARQLDYQSFSADNITEERLSLKQFHTLIYTVSQKTPQIYSLTAQTNRSHYRAMHFSAKRGIAIACRLSVCL